MGRNLLKYSILQEEVSYQGMVFKSHLCFKVIRKYHMLNINL